MITGKKISLNSPQKEQKWNECFTLTIELFLPTAKGWLMQLDADRLTIVDRQSLFAQKNHTHNDANYGDYKHTHKICSQY